MTRPLAVKYAKTGQLATILAGSPTPNFGRLAACDGEDPELFFAEAPALIAEAKAICNVCPVLEQCAKWGLESVNFGILGGMTEKERFMKRGAKDAPDFSHAEQVRTEIRYIFESSSATVAIRYGVDARTVARWRQVLSPYRKAA